MRLAISPRHDDHRAARRRRAIPAAHLQALARGPLAATLPRSTRLRSAGAPEDRALYICACGCGFHAAVTASVCCPDCAAEQSW
ncbi:MAG: hypothetical protein F2796_06150 [Actinobacteria bacterium]|nr:hypothetical protein [Actinomycetota bacterium]